MIIVLPVDEKKLLGYDQHIAKKEVDTNTDNCALEVAESTDGSCKEGDQDGRQKKAEVIG